MGFSLRCTWPLLCLIALALSACGSPEPGENPGGSGPPEGTQDQGSITANEGKVDMAAHAVTIHKMTAEMVTLMDDVHRKKIISPPAKVSDVRNAFMERLDWLDDMSADDVAKLRQATVDLEALTAEIRAHSNAAGDAALAARLKTIEDWNRSIKEGLPK